ncbi:Bromo adjacent homology (BAH) domain [Macleaya cordata]|uniref:Bromo adjacent homology (BAH) domain n=1 Tax=Macleaya cordata TaxID=56857 RepID=A0A200QF73_MACCD|nr:Bromo adjacent homology (BAH) domain [Macleaya cordata]
MMYNQRFALTSTSNSEGEAVGERKAEEDESRPIKKMKNKEECKEQQWATDGSQAQLKKKKNIEEESKTREDEDEEAAVQENAKPIGKVIKVSSKSILGKRNHYNAFEYEGNRFELDDPVLIVPEDIRQKHKFAIIKEITQDIDGNMMVTSQWFYLPEEAKKRGGGSWEARDNRELFYSFYRDEVPAKCLMHKCVVHFVPLHKQLPVYDTVEKTLWGLTDNDYEDNKQHEIELLVQKTQECLGKHTDDINTEEAALPDLEYHQLKNQRRVRKSLFKSHRDVSRVSYDTTKKTDHQHLTTECNPGSCTGDTSEFYAILAKFEALTGETIRDKWLEKLLHGIQFLRDYSKDNKQVKCLENVDDLSSQDKGCGTRIQYWPNAAVSAIVTLEQVLHGDLGHDFRKYNRKMRQLCYNLNKNELLTKRLVKQELEASVILNMSSDELKSGCLMTEIATRKEPADEESEHMQMTDVRCSRCMEKKVGLRDIIQAGRGERYQLACTACGNTWYAFSR